MSDILPTVKIKADGPKGFRIINESAFDPSVHKRYEAEKIAPPEKRGPGRPKKQAVTS